MRRKIHFLLFLFLCITSIPLAAQNIEIKGIVTEAATNEPLPGVTVSIKGKDTGTVTDMDGKYSIKTNQGDILRFSAIGMKQIERAVTSGAPINVSMEEDNIALEQVVVIGYGTVKKSHLSGAVSSVSAKELNGQVASNAATALQGKIPGVSVASSSGDPNGTMTINVRGISSLSNNNPLYVIDGAFGDISMVDPNDISSIEVLKDAAAAAIYGSRAAGGVVLITTKSGRKDMPTKLDINFFTGISHTPKTLKVFNGEEYSRFARYYRLAGDGYGSENGATPFIGEGTDWQDEMFSKAMMTSHNLSVTGGTDKSNYALGAGYLNQDGIAVGSGFRRLNLRGSFDAQVKSYLKMGINFAFSNSRQKLTVSDESLIRTALLQSPSVAVRNAEGTFDGPDTDEWVQSNPVGLAMIKDNRNEKMGIRANTYAEATIIDGLTFKTELSFDYGVANTYKFDPSYTFGAIENTDRQGTFSKSYNKFWSWRNIVNYMKTFGVHNVNAMIGQEMQESKWEYLMGSRMGYLSNAATDLTLGDAATAKNNGNSGESSILSYFGRLFYSYDDKYLLTFTLRRDGSSKFYKDNRWGWFPSAALAWKVSNESFLKDNNIINNLKLRLGWGVVGNQNVPNNAYKAIYSSVATVWGTGLLAGNTPNPELKWESTYSSNLGLDINLFQNRIELIADIYYKKTNDLLLQVPLPAYVGTSGQGSTSAPWKNVGSLENKGLELTLNTVNIDKGGFQWRSNVVFSMNRNKVKSLDTATSLIDKSNQTGETITVLTRTSVGNPIGQFYGYKVIGRFEKATDFYYKDASGAIKPVALPEGMSISKNSVWIGDYIFEDVNKDGVINEQDRTYIGNPEPDFTFGFGNSFSYKGFDLSINLTGSVGNEVVNWGRRELENPRGNNNILKSALDYAQLALIDPNGPDDYRNIQIVGGDPYACRMAIAKGTDDSNYRFSDRFVEDGSFLRIQSISFGYTFPRKWLAPIGIQNLKLYCNLQNVYTFTKYKGMDPEIGSANQDALLTGFDNYRYPSPRIYTFGLNLTF